MSTRKDKNACILICLKCTHPLVKGERSSHIGGDYNTVKENKWSATLGKKDVEKKVVYI